MYNTGIVLSALAGLSGLGGLAAGADIPLATFDGAEDTTREWNQQNDPVMGGRSTGTWVVDDVNMVGVFDGEVVEVPSLRAPGFIKSETVSSNFPDVRGCTGLKLNVMASNDYSGYRFAFGRTKAPGGAFFARGYKSDFQPPVGVFGDIILDFTEFTDNWDDATGDAIKTCSDNEIYCPNQNTLENMEVMSVWGEGVDGALHLEIKSIMATGCPDSGTSPSDPVPTDSSSTDPTDSDTDAVSNSVPLVPYVRSAGRSQVIVEQWANMMAIFTLSLLPVMFALLE